MNSEAIFAMGLGLVTPWEVTGVEFKDAGALFTDRELHIQIGFARGSQFLDEAGILCDVHDTQEKTWKHLNFFQHKCYIHCQVPRIKTSNGKVLLVDVPWLRKESGFTLLFEGYALKLIENEMLINKVGEVLGEYTMRRRVIHATPGVDPMQIEHASIDLSPAFISGLEVNCPWSTLIAST